MRVRSVGSVRRLRSSVCGLGQGSRFCSPAREGFCWKICSKKNLKLGSRVRAGWTWSGWLASLFSFFAMDYVRYTAPSGLLENTRQLGLHSRTLDMFLMLDVVLLRGRIISGRYKTSHHPPPALSLTNKPETKRSVIIARNRHLGRVYANRPNVLEYSAERVVYP
jgi:hypothetical protein